MTHPAKSRSPWISPAIEQQVWRSRNPHGWQALCRKPTQSTQRRQIRPDGLSARLSYPQPHQYPCSIRRRTAQITPTEKSTPDVAPTANSVLKHAGTSSGRLSTASTKVRYDEAAIPPQAFSSIEALTIVVLLTSLSSVRHLRKRSRNSIAVDFIVPANVQSGNHPPRGSSLFRHPEYAAPRHRRPPQSAWPP